MSTPDRERTAVSEAEARAFGGTDAEHQLPLAVLVARATEVITSGWWGEAGGPPVTVVACRRRARSSRARWCATDGSPTIALADGQHDLATVAHELAHVLAGIQRGHDAVFRAAALDLVAVVVGAPARAALSEAFGAFGLTVAPPWWPPPWRVAGPGFRMGSGVALT